ncbi:hypothetical protein NEA10_06440 [Phormidium yuhuli AB48]|uniref:Uncharacterized protein n=1 Tax=Phormidium yuhuli AB48 TaxID=2940671 RepID=A0ABY5ASZ9_9CYAN|nr:hypothetical protein [Phormidium yuhuli]USR92357.1 hypothetical protein NEA10_06440 [Phormidium yuhuli AB48]
MENSDFSENLEDFEGDYLETNLQLKLASMKLELSQVEQEVQAIKNLSTNYPQKSKRIIKIKLRSLHDYFESLQEEAKECQDVINSGFTRLDSFDEEKP